MKYIDGNPELAHRLGGSTVLEAEVVHAVREEMAETLADVVFRRTDLGTGGHPGEEALQACARLMASESGWDENRVRDEINEARNEFLRHHCASDALERRVRHVNVLITGGTGFIGSRLGLRCLAGGHSVSILGQENTPAESSNRKLLEEKGARILLASVAQKDLLSGMMRGIDVVYHLAAAQHEVNVPDQRFRDVNVEGTSNLLEASVRAGVKRFVHGSTIGVYGSAMEGSIDESTPVQPDNIYGITKLEGENVVFSFKEKIPVVIIRIPETYGPGDRRLLKLFKAIRKGLFVMIGAGKNLHHLIYIDDLIDAFFLAAENPDAIGNLFVVAGKEAITTNEMAAVIARQVGGKIPGVRLPLSPFLVLAYVLEKTCMPFGIKPPIHRRRMDFFRKSYAFSQGKAQKILGFHPQVSFSEGIASTAAWYRGMNLL